MMFVRALSSLAYFVSLSAASLLAQSGKIGWPTPSTEYFEGKPIETFIQPTASGVPESGLYGCVRSGGAQFHEGIDIKPVKRDRRGEPMDPIFAVMPGVVRHISSQAGDSSYGRYIVIEHTAQSPAVFTLYAHLARIAPGLKVGDRVDRDAIIAVMGRSASGYAIPRHRAHLHFELGVWLTRDFQSWYNWKRFGSRNEHGFWNGMNLMGVDPLDVYQAFRSGRVNDFDQYFAQLTPAVTLRIATRKTPDFVERYPALLTKPLPGVGRVDGWQVTFNEMGVPFAWTPLSSMDTAGYEADEIRILDTNEAVLKRNRCKSLVFTKRGKPAVGKDLETVLQLLFGLREEL